MSQSNPDPGAYVISAALLAGERRELARTISQVERGELDHAGFSAALRPHLGRAHVLGITGAPGAGKSSLIDALLGEMLARGLRVAVLAVDPSSPISGGALLGDRVRMDQHGAHPHLFIRSQAARGHLGGLSKSTQQIVDVLDAAGFDSIIVETVGVGQSEVEIMHLADTRLLLCPPGLGDQVQALKAGILEIADLLLVSKSDLSGAAACASDLRAMLQLRSRAPDAWQVPVLQCSAIGHEGVSALLDCINEHQNHAGRAQRLHQRPALGLPDRPLPGQALALQLAGADPFASSLGISCTEAGLGHATVVMQVRQQHLNFNGSAHGGAIFTLADTAFALASNAYGKVAVGIDAHISYQTPARLGERLTARASEVSRSRKLAVYRVEVSRADGALISSFTGTAYLTQLEPGNGS